MKFSDLYQKVVLLSPRIEVMIRCFYWNNIKQLKRFRSASVKAINIDNKASVNFLNILNYLRANGVGKDDIMIVHSSFDSLKSCNLSAEEFIDYLYTLVDGNGTLAMPAIRKFIEEGGEGYLENYINNELKGITTLYDLYRTPISSGLLPFTLMRYDDAEVSLFPLNPLVAIGNQAKAMMEHNIEGNLPSAHGPNSCWAYCAKHNAWNIGIGVDIKDYLTIFHIAQEIPEWPVKDWYFERNFIIKKNKKEISLKIIERKHKWTKYIAESNFYNDLIKSNILKTANINGIPVYMTRSNELFEFIRKQKNPSYPYFIPKKYLRK